MPSRPVAVRWYERASNVGYSQYWAAQRFSGLNFWFGLPTVIFATIVGTSVFATLQTKPEFWWQVTVGFMSIAAAILSGLQAFLGFNDKAEKHRTAGDLCTESAQSRKHDRRAWNKSGPYRTQYASAAHQALLAEHGLVGSMSRKGNCWDSAVMERFFLNLKMERVWQKDYANHAEAASDVVDYIVGILQRNQTSLKTGQPVTQRFRA